MSELFSQSGQSEDVAVSAPLLQANFIPAIDKLNMQDGFGIVTPLGGGATSRSYLEYGGTGEVSSYNTLLNDITRSLIPSAGGGEFNVNIEGMIGPQGIPGQNGLPGVTSIINMAGPSGLFALSDQLQQLNLLGSAIDQMIYTVGIKYYNNWTDKSPSSPQVNYGNLACDSDMSHILIAAFSSYLWVSTDSGDTWNYAIESAQNWACAACDSDGSNMIAGYAPGPLYISTSSGASGTWVETQPAGDTSKPWVSLAMDSDGSFIVAGASAGRLYTTANGGSSWTERRPAGDTDAQWVDVDCDADGSFIVAAALQGRLWKSSDSGATWSEMRPDGDANKYWNCIACSSSGQKIVVGTSAAGGGKVFRSKDGGETWKEVYPTGVAGATLYWINIDISSDGNTIIIVDYNGYVYSSFDMGDSWGREPIDGTTSHWWRDCAISSDGALAVVCAGNNDSNAGVFTSLSYGSGPMWSETTITEYARTLVDDSTPAEAKGTLELDTDDSVEFADLTLNTPSNIYALSHDSFADFVANEHIDHSGITITAGTGLSGGGTIDGNVTLNCDITQYTDNDALAAVAAVLDDGTVGNIVFSAVGGVISGTTQDGEIDHDALNNTHNLTTDIDHDALTNFASNKHFVQTDIDHVDTDLATGLLKVTTGTGALSVITDSSANWDTAHNWGDHSGLYDATGTAAGLLAAFTGSANIVTVGTLTSGAIGAGFTEIATTYTAAKCTDATADNTAGNETSHADVLVDGDFASAGLMNTDGAGAYSIKAIGTDVQAYHANLAAIVGGTWTGANSITTLGTIATGTWEATDVGIAHGGTGQSTAQAAIDALTAVGAATNEHVLTKDTDTGNAIWKVAAGGGTGDTYVDRGDPATWDWIETGSKAVLNTDGNWHDLDLSGIVPAEAAGKLVHIRYWMQHANAGQAFYVRLNGRTNSCNADGDVTAGTTGLAFGSWWILCDANRVIEYMGTNTSFNNIYLSIRGWCI